ncbi:GLOBIN domain-containing protein [Lachancea thermotolerans]
MEENRSFYSPLDRSQIAFIPADLESISENDPSVEPSPGLPRLSGDSHIFKESFRDSYVPSVTSQSIFSEAHPPSSLSSVDELDRLSSLSSGSSCGTNMSYAARYKIVLKLTSREIKLIRESWSMMLNDELSGDNLRTFIRKIVHEIGGLPWVRASGRRTRNNSQNTSLSANSSASSPGSGSPPSPKHASAIPTGNTGAFASSIFCQQFYGNLLYMAPSIEAMFPSIRHQAVSFAGVLTMTVNNLDNLSALEAYLCALGKRHARILSIEPPHFELMGLAFLKTIKDRFGVHCTLELEETWSRLYSYLANSILQFGIDPVLKIDALKNEMVFPVPDVTKGLPSTKSMFQPLQPSALNAHALATQKLRNNSRPENISPLTKPPISSKKSLPISTSNRNISGSALPQQHKKEQQKPKPLGASALKRDSDKDCVIM